TSEPSNASTNVVNAPREPYVVKQVNGIFVDEIIFDLNRAPDSPTQFHCFHCKDVLSDGEACKRCIFCKRCTCKFCGKNAHIGYNCPLKVPVISIPEPCNNQTIDELPQALPIFRPTFHSEAESPFTLDSTPTYVDDSPNIFNPPPQPPKQEEKWIEEEQAAKAQSWKFPVCYDDDDDEEGYNSLNDNIISELPTDDQSLSDEVVREKIYSNPLFDEEIIHMEIDQHRLNAESDLIESMPNHDSSVIISSKIGSLFDEFAGELTLLKSFSSGDVFFSFLPKKWYAICQGWDLIP
nr:hypothetical protein [Tanacetum cinerariifolium]